MATSERAVFLNVYDLHDSNAWLQRIGMGLFHTGVEVGGMEYSFNEAGIFKCTPKRTPPPAVFRESIQIGVHEGSANEVSQIIRELREEFSPGTYNLVNKNCNAFSNEFCIKLVQTPIPKWVNRLASWGGAFMFAGTDTKSDGGPNSTAAQEEKMHAKKELTEQQKVALRRLKSKR